MRRRGTGAGGNAFSCGKCFHNKLCCISLKFFRLSFAPIPTNDSVYLFKDEKFVCPPEESRRIRIFYGGKTYELERQRQLREFVRWKCQCMKAGLRLEYFIQEILKTPQAELCIQPPFVFSLLERIYGEFLDQLIFLRE